MPELGGVYTQTPGSHQEDQEEAIDRATGLSPVAVLKRNNVLLSGRGALEGSIGWRVRIKKITAN